MKLKTNLKRFLRQIFVLIALVSSSSVFANIENAGFQDLKGTKINLDAKQGKISEIMDKISKSTEYVFIYEDGIKDAHKTAQLFEELGFPLENRQC